MSNKPRTSSRGRSRHHNRRHSWPPLRLQVFKPNPVIDENPFAFFISAPEEDLDTFTDDAGIENTPPRSRSLSPFHRHTSNPSSPVVSAASTNPLIRLKRWIERMERRYFHRQPASPDSPSTSPDVRRLSPTQPVPIPNSPGSLDLRGRESYRLSPPGSRQGAVRSHSGRPRVWRGPSQDIWPVMEEQELEMGLGISI